MKLNHSSFSVVAVLLTLNAVAFATDLLVPSQYPTIQEGIGASVDGDRVIVAKGTYYENIDFGGKSITVTSTDLNEPAATVIDANRSGTVVTFPDVPSANCVLAGFTITDGNTSVNGGGMLCLNGSIEINNCIISDNIAAENGGGIYTYRANLTLTDCVFSQNTAYGVGNLAGGGGIFTRYGGLILTDCRFNDNTAVNSSGGGIRCTDAELTLDRCTFLSNSAVREGGGVSTDIERTTLTDCTFKQNSAIYFGGGMCNSHRGATVTNCLFASNSAERGGGIAAMDLHSGDLTLNNCTFSNNIADYFGGAVGSEDLAHAVLTNCILWGNLAYEGPQIALEKGGTLSVSYSCVQGADQDIYAPTATVDWQPSNIDTDPCIADAAADDCHLKSTAGRWDPNQEAWIIDATSSLCIDAGNPGCPPADETSPNGDRVNMGAYGGTDEASRSPTDWNVLADLTNDRAVDYKDLRFFVDYWLEAGQCIPADLSHDQSVNLLDLAIFTKNWDWKK
ncbi:MAG: right-handed parallel beta-helix repeat-containing protein [Planctomycetota bacterium]|jgi:parallel beta-helix repeat protein/predicted outer membrane repeat protein